MTDETPHDDFAEEEMPLDVKAAKADIAAGIRALKHLTKTAGHNWTSGWSIAVRGWRGLREVAFKRAGTRDIKTQAYRDAISDLLAQVGNVDYRNIPKETRAAMTRLIDHIDEVDAWYATLSMWDRERWTNPQTIVKHCPAHLLVGRGHNKPMKKKTGPRKRKGNPEAESLRAILIKVITKYVMPVDPEEAKALLDGLYADQSDLDDGLDDLNIDEVGDEEVTA